MRRRRRRRRLPRESFDAFWRRYLRMHREPRTQQIHAVATSSALALAGLALIRRQPLLLALAPVVDFAIAQASHRVVEKNKTRPWRDPWRHARAELRLFRLTVTGRIDAEVERVCPKQ